MPSIHKFKDKMWLIDREKGLVYIEKNLPTFATCNNRLICK